MFYELVEVLFDKFPQSNINLYGGIVSLAIENIYLSLYIYLYKYVI